jgi:ferritin-like protein
MTDDKQSDEKTEKAEKTETASKPAEGARRQLLNAGAAGAAAMVLGLVAAACSSDGDDTSATGGNGGTGGKAATGGAGGKGGTGGTGGTGGKGATGGGAGATSAGAGGANSVGEAGTSSAGEGGAGGAASIDADVAQLNALLAAEYNAIAAYSAGATLITAAATTDKLYALRDTIKAIAVSIQTDHTLHAAALVTAITDLNGKPVAQADVAAKFVPPAGLVNVPTISNVLKFAASAERGAAVAYNQVIFALQDAKYRFLASAIEGDETQHFIVLAALVLGLASPGPSLTVTTATKVVPEPFVSTVGAQPGLDSMTGVPDNFA